MRGSGRGDHKRIDPRNKESLRAFRLLCADGPRDTGRSFLVGVDHSQPRNQGAAFEAARVKRADPTRPHQTDVHVRLHTDRLIGNVPTGTFPQV